MNKAHRGFRAIAAIYYIIALGLFAASGVSAETRLIQPGDDLPKAFANAKPGDEFVLADGEWKDKLIELHAEGTADAPITLRAQTPGKVVLTGKSGLKFSGRHINVSGLHFHNVNDANEIIQFRTSSKSLAEHCRLTNCAITSDAVPSNEAEQKWVSIYGKHNRVDHSHFTGKKTGGTLLVVWVAGGDNHHQIDHNYFGPRTVLGKNGGETIRVGTSDVSMNASYTIVEDNFFEECNGEAEIVSNKSGRNIYRRNTFRECSGALTLRHGNDCRVEQNYFLGNKARGTGGVRIIGTGHVVINNYFADLEGDDSRSAISFMNGLVNSPLHGYFQVENAIVAYNTFIDCKVAMTIGVEASKKQPLAPKNCQILNNLSIGRRNEIREEAQPENFKQAGNLKVSSTSDLKFQKDSHGIYRPTTGSQSLGQADMEWTQITDDIDGQKRAAPYDAGCDQFGTDTRPPLRRNDVGTDWNILVKQ